MAKTKLKLSDLHLRRSVCIICFGHGHKDNGTSYYDPVREESIPALPPVTCALCRGKGFIYISHIPDED
jgi:hypothetical protein